ncbi:hypothetical protein [Mangrovimonas sp. TPBH4]|uniref:hypothetical protein n=1 Tax=Mangrovimonas sp. TPBH4 TaxID=1645914 RepID=UPI0006B42A35|nr:hypothetical protein [Mangrovimonas sp. TPBH4]
MSFHRVDKIDSKLSCSCASDKNTSEAANKRVASHSKLPVNRSPKQRWISKISNTIQQVVFPILVVFFPKCPICWAAYLSVFGISGLQSIPYSPWLLPVIFVIMLFNLVLLYRKAKLRNGFFPFWISLIGTLLVVSGYPLKQQSVSFVGIGLIFIGAVSNSLSFKHWRKLKFSIESILLHLKIKASPKVWISKTEVSNFHKQ